MNVEAVACSADGNRFFFADIVAGGPVGICSVTEYLNPVVSCRQEAQSALCA